MQRIPARETTEIPLLTLAYVREWCDEVAGREIHRTTWSRWCSRFAISGRAETEVDISIAAALLTCAALHRFGSRNYSGDAYKNLYPPMHNRVREICNV
jgi:hypothetical protein